MHAGHFARSSFTCGAAALLVAALAGACTGPATCSTCLARDRVSETSKIRGEDIVLLKQRVDPRVGFSVQTRRISHSDQITILLPRVDGTPHRVADAREPSADPISPRDQTDASRAPSASTPVAEAPRDPVSPTTREQRRYVLTLMLATNPGWKLDETAHYFIVTAVDDASFIAELKLRCESIRRSMQREFPHPELDPVPVFTAPNVIRVCCDRDEYMRYGAPSGSAGYWSWVDEELVIFDDRSDGGVANTWAALNGMVFYEYLFGLEGPAVPPEWFRSGYSDYYSGFEFEHGVHAAAAFAWRADDAARNARTGAFMPFDEFVQLDRLQVPRASAGHELDHADLVVQAWSFIWFLRQGANSCPTWDPTWSTLLDTWWMSWHATHDARLANERAFGEVDWTALTAAWKQFTVELK